MIKTLQKVGIEGNIFNLVKTMYKKLTANIIFNGDRFKAFPLTLDTSQGCPLLPLLFNMILQFLAKTRNKRNQKAI